MKRIAFFITILASLTLCTLSSLNAQTCKASAPAKVGINQGFQYQVTVDRPNVQVASKNFGTMQQLGSPMQQSMQQMSIVNGQMTATRSTTYVFTLRPTKVGRQTIPGVVVVVDGKQISSNSVTIEVTQEDQGNSRQRAQQQRSRQQYADPFEEILEEFFGHRAAPQPQDIESGMFLRAYPSKTNPYQGEEVVITYKLYFSNVYQYQVTGTEFPQQPNLWTYQLGNPGSVQTPHNETINGKTYNVIEVYKTAVYPQKSGTITVTPLLLKGVAIVPSGMWGGARQEQNSVKSNAVTLQVKELPQAGRPANFSGLVGNFSLKSSLTKDKLKTNDATDLVVTISGSGNLQLAEALAFTFPSDFDVNDPAINDNIHTAGNSVNGSRSFDYTIIPRAPGKFTIPAASFVYFDPKTQTYKTLTTDPYSLNVEKGEDDNGFSSSQHGLTMLDKDIRFIRTDLKKLTTRSRAFVGSPLYWILLLLPFLLFVIYLIIRRKQFANRQNIAELRNKRANKVAIRSLKKAKKLLDAGKEEAFYVEISRALWGYMCDKFRIQLADLSIDAARAKLSEKNLPAEDIDQFVKTLNDCEFARFAPDSGTAMMHDLYEQSLDFITNIEKK